MTDQAPGFNLDPSDLERVVAAEEELEIAFAGLTHVVRVATSAEHGDRNRLFDTLTALRERYGDVSVVVDPTSRDPDTQRIGRHAGHLGIWVDTEIKRMIDNS